MEGVSQWRGVSEHEVLRVAGREYTILAGKCPLAARLKGNY